MDYTKLLKTALTTLKEQNIIIRMPQCGILPIINIYTHDKN